jgi:hypothetical protein
MLTAALPSSDYPRLGDKDPNNLTIGISIEREDQVYRQGETSTRELKRRAGEIGELPFPRA